MMLLSNPCWQTQVLELISSTWPLAVHVVGTILLDGAKELTAEISELTKLVTKLVTEAASDDTANDADDVISTTDEAPEKSDADVVAAEKLSKVDVTLSVAVTDRDPDSDDNAVPVV